MHQGRALLLALALCAASGCAARQTDAPPDAAYEPAHPAALPAAGAAVAGAPDPGADDEVLDDSAFDAAPDSGERIADPLEPWNRMWFAFNDFTYMNIFKPFYKAYAFVTPEMLRSGLSNAQRNLKAPIRIVNSILQLEFPQAVVEFGRFVVNTTAGGLGLAEIVKPEAALVPINLATADFDGTLAKWGMGEGVYLVWPFLGPSTVRDTVGMGGDIFTGFSFWVTEPIGPVKSMVAYCVTYGLRLNDLGAVLSSYETLTKTAIEPYASLRDAYAKLRRNSERARRVADPTHMDVDVLRSIPAPSK